MKKEYKQGTLKKDYGKLFNQQKDRDNADTKRERKPDRIYK
jgi:cytidylate kinase